MPNVDAFGAWSNDPGVYKYTHLGTAAGTTTINTQPAFLSHIQVNNRAASGTIIVYDSAGTSGTVIASVILGTQTGSDPNAPLTYKAKTLNGLTVYNSANLDLTVASLP